MEAAGDAVGPRGPESSQWTLAERKALLFGALFLQDDWDAIAHLLPGKQARLRRTDSPACPARTAQRARARAQPLVVASLRLRQLHNLIG
jgi:hypothetical protein